jgi:Major Facilitator Superfamily
VPIGVVALVASLRYVPESRADLQHRHLDLGGAITVTAGLVAIVFGIVRTETYSWGSAQVLMPLALGVVFIAVFLYLQARVSKAPLVPLDIFRSRNVAGGNAVMLLMFGALFGSWYFETLYMQHVLGYSPLRAGLAFLPQTLLIAAGAQVTSRLVPRFGPRPLILVGSLVAAAGVGWLTQITPTSTFIADILGPYVLIGLGMGLTVTPIAVAGTAGVPHERAGLASGLLNTSRTVGASLGLAVLATLAGPERRPFSPAERRAPPIPLPPSPTGTHWRSASPPGCWWSRPSSHWPRCLRCARPPGRPHGSEVRRRCVSSWTGRSRRPDDYVAGAPPGAPLALKASMIVATASWSPPSVWMSKRLMA